MDFRHDINALRAFAVVAVVLYHFSVPGFAGGFIGVDVFFVISGYLMASIIVTRLEQETFSAGRFYLARARRIVPALAVMIATLLLLGWWLLPPVDYRELASNTVFALAFIANIRFQRDAGYFEPASHDNWLLHTWSLAIEAQFYLLLPILLILLWRLKLRALLLPTLIILMLASLARSIWLAANAPDSAFYLLDSRAWQLLAGAVAFLVVRQSQLREVRRYPGIMAGAGLLLIVAALAGIDASTPWPGTAAIIPVMGTVLILMARHQAAWMHWRPVHYLGLSSYSVYLWHWPVVVAISFLGMAGDSLAILAGMLFALILGLLSWQLVEFPGRQRWQGQQSRHSRQSSQRLALTLAVVITPAIVVYLHDGIPGRLPVAAEQAAAEADNIDPRRDECLANSGAEFPWCQYGGPETRAVVVGDSHASMLFTAFTAAAQAGEGSAPEKRQAGIIASAFNGCPTLLEGTSVNDSASCRAFNRYLIEQLQTVDAKVPLIIVNRSSVYHLGSSIPSDKDYQRPIVSYDRVYDRPAPSLTTRYTQDLIATACHFAQQRPVFLVRPIPEMRVDVPRTLARQHLWHRAGEVRLSRQVYDQRHSAVWQAQDLAARQCGVQILDSTQSLCDRNYCYGSEKGRPLYYDEDHLSEFGALKGTEGFSELNPSVPFN